MNVTFYYFLFLTLSANRYTLVPRVCGQRSVGFLKIYVLLEAKTRISQQEWNDTNVHNAVFIRPLLGVSVNNDYLTEKIS